MPRPPNAVTHHSGTEAEFWQKHPDQVGQLPRTKAAAVAGGYQVYFSGKRCVNRHLLPRKVNNGHCVGCNTNNNNRTKVRKVIKENPGPVARHKADDLLHQIQQRKLERGEL